MCSSNPLWHAPPKRPRSWGWPDRWLDAQVHSKHANKLSTRKDTWRAGTATTYSVLSPPSSLHCLCGRICGSKLTSPQRLPPVQLVLKPNVHQIKHAASRCGLCGNNSHRKENIPAVAFHTPKASQLVPTSTSTPQQLAPICHLVAATLATPVLCHRRCNYHHSRPLLFSSICRSRTDRTGLKLDNHGCALRAPLDSCTKIV